MKLTANTIIKLFIDAIGQDAMIDEIKDIQQEEADMDSISTSGDDW